MALMSANRYLSPLEAEAAYRKVVSLLLDAVATNAPNLDSEVYQNFSGKIGQLRQSLASETTLESLMKHAAAAVQTIAEYTQEINRLLHTQIDEMQKTIATLAQPSAASAGAGPREAALHRSIGDSREGAAAIPGIAILRARLQESAENIRQERTGVRAEPGQPDRTMGWEGARKLDHARGPDFDPVTELPGEAAARAQFLTALHSGEQRHVVVFVLGSAQRINLRFGREVGDEVVRELKRYVASQLQPGDRMFRWPGPAIVALLAGSEQFEKIRSRMKRFLEKSIEREFDVNGRSVLIPLSIAWSVYPVSLPLAGVNRQIHDFIAGQGYRDEDPVPA